MANMNKASQTSRTNLLHISREYTNREWMVYAEQCPPIFTSSNLDEAKAEAITCASARGCDKVVVHHSFTNTEILNV